MLVIYEFFTGFCVSCPLCFNLSTFETLIILVTCAEDYLLNLKADNVMSVVEASERHFCWAVGQCMKWARHTMYVVCLRRLVCWTDVPRQKLLVITLIQEEKERERERAAFYSC